MSDKELNNKIRDYVRITIGATISESEAEKLSALCNKAFLQRAEKVVKDKFNPKKDESDARQALDARITIVTINALQDEFNE